MPAFRFHALDPQGRAQRGVLQADSPRQVRASLREQGLTPLQVEPVLDASTARRPAGPGLLGPRRVFSNDQKSVWLRQLASLVSSGLPLDQALSGLLEQCETPRQRELQAAVLAEVQGGRSLSSSLELLAREFDDTERAVIAASERSGQLGPVLTQMADRMQEQQALRAKLLAAALYPAIVTGVAVVLSLFLMTSVVPQVAQVFEGQHRALPWLTRVMLAISRFLVQWGWLLALLLVAAVLLARQALQRPALRQRFDAAQLRWPLIGPLLRGYNSARFASTLGMLSHAGVPILKGLQAAIDTLPNHALRQDAQTVLGQVREGAPLGLALQRSGRFLPLLHTYARLGEQTGQLPQMLQQAASQIATDVQRRALALTALLEPLLILLMGVQVMLIVLSVLMPIIELNQLAR